MQSFPQSRPENRFDKVDVLSLIDPDWLENSQASKLVQMMAECESADDEVEDALLEPAGIAA